MTRLAELEKELRVHEARAAALRSEITARKRGPMVTCSACNRRAQVKRLTYIQTHFYIEPYSCTGGDYWKQGEGRFVCVYCGHENRLYDRPDVVKLKHQFAEVKDTHGR